MRILREANMTTTTETLIGVGCDPQCKWASAILGLVAKREEEEAAIEQVPDTDSLGNPTGMRPTPAGYVELARIESDYIGIRGLEISVEGCKRACAPERHSSPDLQFGSEVQSMINNLTGEQR